MVSLIIVWITPQNDGSLRLLLFHDIANLRKNGAPRSLATNEDNPSVQLAREEEESDETQVEIAKSVRKWGRATCYLGLALALSAGFWVSFFPGHSLHPLWNTWGRVLAVVSLCIFLPWLYAAATTFNLWLYGANLRKIDRDFATEQRSKP